jgi:hypothetical protein
VERSIFNKKRESKKSQKPTCHKKCLFGRRLPHLCHKLSESKVASSQSKQGNNERDVEAMLFRVVARHKLPVFKSSKKSAKTYVYTYQKFRNTIHQISTVMDVHQ